MAIHNIIIVLKAVDKFSSSLQAISDAYEKMAIQLSESTQELTPSEKRHAVNEAILRQRGNEKLPLDFSG